MASCRENAHNLISGTTYSQGRGVKGLQEHRRAVGSL
jgi:hypothetical protein